MKSHKDVWLFLLAWVLTAPLAASIATQTPHVMRSYTALPGLQIIEAIGLLHIARSLPRAYLRWAAGILAVVIALSFVSFWKGYFVRFPKEQSDSFQYAMKDAVDYAVREGNAYERVEFANQGALYQSYMFYLYYARIDPLWYLSQGGTKSGGYNEAHSFGTFSSGFLPREVQGAKSGVLYFYDAREIPTGFTVKKKFTLMDGSPAIVAAEKTRL